MIPRIGHIWPVFRQCGYARVWEKIKEIIINSFFFVTHVYKIMPKIKRKSYNETVYAGIDNIVKPVNFVNL